MEVGNTVLVTGFGPFANHKINASWEAVKELAEIGFDKNVNLIAREIPVEYDSVNKMVPKLWQEFMPKLCVHVGVCDITTVMMIEKCAHNSEYIKEDISGKCPDSNCCVPGGCDCLYTNINVDKIREDNDEESCPCVLESSCDAGRFLCEFIYHKSLNECLKPEHNGASVVFIHVPILGKPYSTTQLAESLKYLVLEMLNEENMIKDPCQNNHN